MAGCNAADLINYYKRNIARDQLYPIIINYNDFPIALIEIYPVTNSPISQFVPDNQTSVGIHTLMGPPRYLLGKLPVRIPNISKEAITTALHFVFSLKGYLEVYTEPDKNNKNANKLAKELGFTFLKEIQLEDKKANLYVFKKSDFLTTHPLNKQN